MGLLTGKTRKHLCAENLAGSVALSVLDGTSVAGREEQYALVAHQLYEVVVEIARLIGILQDKEEPSSAYCRKCQGCRRVQ